MGPLSGATIVELGAMLMKVYSAFPKDPELIEPHHHIVKCHIQDNRLGWGLIRRCILQPQPTEPRYKAKTLIEQRNIHNPRIIR